MPEGKNKVEFDFHVDDRVIDQFGKEGIVENCTIGKSGKRYWVKKEVNSCWEDEGSIVAKQ